MNGRTIVLIQGGEQKVNIYMKESRQVMVPGFVDTGAKVSIKVLYNLLFLYKSIDFFSLFFL